jgi:hypothetical protein
MLKKPYVGLPVQFHSDAVAQRRVNDHGGFNGVGAGPYAAVVTQVFTDSSGNVMFCNLKVFPPFAPPFDEGSVSEGAESCPARYWTWAEPEAPTVH